MVIMIRSPDVTGRDKLQESRSATAYQERAQYLESCTGTDGQQHKKWSMFNHVSRSTHGIPTCAAHLVPVDLRVLAECRTEHRPPLSVTLDLEMNESAYK